MATLDRHSTALWFLFFGCAQIVFGVLNLRELYAREYAFWWFLLGPCTLLNGIVRPQLREGGILWSPWVYVPWTRITSYAVAGSTLTVQLRRRCIALAHELTMAVKPDQLGSVQHIMERHISNKAAGSTPLH